MAGFMDIKKLSMLFCHFKKGLYQLTTQPVTSSKILVRGLQVLIYVIICLLMYENQTPENLFIVNIVSGYKQAHQLSTQISAGEGLCNSYTSSTNFRVYDIKPTAKVICVLYNMSKNYAVRSKSLESFKTILFFFFFQLLLQLLFFFQHLTMHLNAK